MDTESVLNIGFDDTDSPTGMCTTFLAYKIVDLLQKQKTEFLDFPKLIRFNPNIPWKTRGNGAVSLKIKTNQPSKIKKQIKNSVETASLVQKHASRLNRKPRRKLKTSVPVKQQLSLDL